MSHHRSPILILLFLAHPIISYALVNICLASLSRIVIGCVGAVAGLSRCQFAVGIWLMYVFRWCGTGGEDLDLESLGLVVVVDRLMLGLRSIWV
jgi:hypothetical protein